MADQRYISTLKPMITYLLPIGKWQWKRLRTCFQRSGSELPVQPTGLPINNWQGVCYRSMAKQTPPSEPQKRRFQTTGLHLPSDLWDLIGRVALERSRTKGGRASASALIVELIERHRKELEKELAAASR